jgi:predicted nucleic acid-binding protein
LDKGSKKREVEVLDASSIGILLGKMREKAVELLEGMITLDLAVYELGNLIWKEFFLKEKISRSEALDRAGDLAKVLGLMNLEKLRKEEDVKGAMMLAADLGLTFYDASYLYIAKSRNAILITEDGELLEKAKEAGVRAISAEEYLRARKLPS